MIEPEKERQPADLRVLAALIKKAFEHSPSDFPSEIFFPKSPGFRTALMKLYADEKAPYKHEHLAGIAVLPNGNFGVTKYVHLGGRSSAREMFDPKLQHLLHGKTNDPNLVRVGLAHNHPPLPSYYVENEEFFSRPDFRLMLFNVLAFSNSFFVVIDKKGMGFLVATEQTKQWLNENILPHLIGNNFSRMAESIARRNLERGNEKIGRWQITDLPNNVYQARLLLTLNKYLKKAESGTMIERIDDKRLKDMGVVSYTCRTSDDKLIRVT